MLFGLFFKRYTVFVIEVHPFLSCSYYCLWGAAFVICPKTVNKDRSQVNRSWYVSTLYWKKCLVLNKYLMHLIVYLMDMNIKLKPTLSLTCRFLYWFTAFPENWSQIDVPYTGKVLNLRERYKWETWYLKMSLASYVIVT